MKSWVHFLASHKARHDAQPVTPAWRRWRQEEVQDNPWLLGFQETLSQKQNTMIPNKCTFWNGFRVAEDLV